MSPELQRIAIAEACGWKGPFTPDPLQLGVLVDCLPNYLNDLNAIHQAEKTLTAEQLEDYGAYLNTWADDGVSLYAPEHSEIACVAMSSAATRCKAFLKTVGRWVD